MFERLTNEGRPRALARALADFRRFFLDTCFDQVRYMATLGRKGSDRYTGRLHYAVGSLAVLLWSAANLYAQTSQNDRQLQVATRFVQLLRSSQFDSASAAIAPDVPLGAMSSGNLRRTWLDLTNVVGFVYNIDPPTVKHNDINTIVEFVVTFQYGRRIIRVVLTPESQVTGLFFMSYQEPYQAPAYVDTTRFEEVPVTIGQAPWTVTGMLSLPKDARRMAAVVLLQGSGPNDRDESFASQRPFRDLAWGLATRGIAVLRYDKRTYAYSRTLDAANITVEQEVVEDALSAIAAVRSQVRIDPHKIFLAGHSLGGFLAPEIASRAGDVRGIAILAANTQPIDRVLRSQLRFLSNLDSVHRTTTSAAYDSANALIDSLSAHTLPVGRMLFGAPTQYYYELMSREPVRIVMAMTIPVLVVGGGSDYQVTKDEFRSWQVALRRRTNVTFHFYLHMNHLLLPSTGRIGPLDYEGTQRHVCPSLVRDITTWIKTI